ncbi:TrmH family RNA methyltransferase [Sediminibacterium soli]|uniref:TrmH family RNA methyltransferase n=1 Tax=Sediminibacterium soli TaxID=2698829 RepID=UPI00137A15F7|nr:RNA methyltransferase [Sediminibacterium soli]NCI46122.1 RNA methyltransferase [Sediminibacterium soli]
MLSKNEVKYIQSLCQKRQRLQEGLFLAEGVKLVDELLQSDFRIRKLYAAEAWIRGHPGVEAVQVTDDELARISGQASPNQVLAVVEQKQPPRLPLWKGRLSLALDGIQDPGNLGTIIRIADWFGIGQIMASEDTVDCYNPKVIQSTMGSFLRVTVWYGKLETALSAAGVPVLGALLDGKNLYVSGKRSEGILLIGNESKGIQPALLPLVTHPITIPRIGGAESLNAAVATGIILSHIV